MEIVTLGCLAYNKLFSEGEKLHLRLNLVCLKLWVVIVVNDKIISCQTVSGKAEKCKYFELVNV